MEKLDQLFESFRVHANELGDKVREVIREGNVRRIIIKDVQGHTFLEIPVSVAAVGLVLAPVLAALGAIATVVAHFEVVVERAHPPDSDSTRKSGSGTGATEEQVNMSDTVPQHSDDRGTKVEDIAGTGEHDSLGG